MANKLYTAKAHVTGGRAEGHGHSSDGVLDVQLRIPPEMGGPGGGTNPEQLFAVGYAACFEGALGVDRPLVRQLLRRVRGLRHGPRTYGVGARPARPLPRE